MLVWDTHKLLCKVARDARMLRSFVHRCVSWHGADKVQLQAYNIEPGARQTADP